MDTDFRIVDFDVVDNSAEISAAERHIALEHIRAHDRDEGGDPVFRDSGIGAHFSDGAVEGDLRDVTFSLHRRDAVFQGRVIRIGDAVLDGLIETAEPPFGF